MYNYLKHKTALYIEDDEDVLKNISSFMQNYFLDVHSAPNAEDGFELFRCNCVDLLMVDIELPGINGIELIKKVREIDKDVSIVIVSAYTNTDYLLESVELKIDKYIVKPFTTKKLYALLDKIDDSFKENNTIKLTSDITLYRDKLLLTFDEEKQILSSKEFLFLELLSVNRFIYYADFKLIWEDITPTQDAIRSFIKTLRKRLPHDTLKNKQNIGYYV